MVWGLAGLEWMTLSKIASRKNNADLASVVVGWEDGCGFLRLIVTPHVVVDLYQECQRYGTRYLEDLREK